MGRRWLSGKGSLLRIFLPPDGGDIAISLGTQNGGGIRGISVASSRPVVAWHPKENEEESTSSSPFPHISLTVGGRKKVKVRLEGGKGNRKRR